MKISNSATGKNLRRIKAANTLTAQLKSGVKPIAGSAIETESLTIGDVTRVEAELTILRGRIVTPEVARSTETKKFRGAK